MDAKDLLLKELQTQLQLNQEMLQRTEAKLHAVATQHTSVTEQFAQALEEKDHKISLLESKIRRLLSTVRGSRQERINPDQLLLLSQEESKQLAQALERNAADNASEPEFVMNSAKRNANARAVAKRDMRWALKRVSRSNLSRRVSRSLNVIEFITLAVVAKKMLLLLNAAERLV